MAKIDKKFIFCLSELRNAVTLHRQKETRRSELENKDTETKRLTGDKEKRLIRLLVR